MDEHIIPFPGVVEEPSINLEEALAMRERRFEIAQIRNQVDAYLHHFAARSKSKIVGEARVTKTGIIVYLEEFQVIRYGALCGMVSQLTLQTAWEIRHICEKAGITFEYGAAVAPVEVEEPVRVCKVRQSGFRPPPELSPIIEDVRRLA